MSFFGTSQTGAQGDYEFSARHVLQTRSVTATRRSGTMMGTSDPTTIYIILAAIVFVALAGLTMRSVIRRERAMIREKTDDPNNIAAYENRWRGQRGA